MSKTPKEDETYTESETKERMDAALRKALNTPPTPHKAKDNGEPKTKDRN
jgi:hypothetical protein